MTARNNKSQSLTDRLNLMFWTTLLRGILAALLGVLLLFLPEKTTPFLISFMGMFWLLSGLLSIRWATSERKVKPLSLIAGVIAVVAGLSALLNRFRPFGYALDEVLIITILGSLLILTGLMHIVGGFRIGEREERTRTVASVLLGVFETFMGLLLIIKPLERGQLIYYLAAIWALLGGFILLGDALLLRKSSRLSRVQADEGEINQE